MKRWGEAMAEASVRLKEAGIASARLDARILLAKAVGVPPARAFSQPANVLSPEEEDRFEAFIDRRLAREPVSRIIERREFWSLDFLVTPAVLDPRPDSETIVEAVLDSVLDRSAPLSLLDFGTGSGCLLLALLSELPNATGLGVDISDEALAVARANARALSLDHRVRFVRGDWGREIDGLFDVIVSNPPYIPLGEIDGLDPEVARFDPRLALAGGGDGLDCYRVLAPQIERLLDPSGLAVLEIGRGQDPDVADVMGQAGLTVSDSRQDLAGITRCLIVARMDKADDNPSVA